MGKRIAVLMGGSSLERDVSLRSGRRIARALRELGYEVSEHDIDSGLVASLKATRPDLVYIALHGKYGEDGTIQEILEILKMPYTGPGVFASTMGFNKALSKEIFLREGIPTPPFFTLSAATFQEMGASRLMEDVAERLGFPLVIKPAAQGSALGVKVVDGPGDMALAVASALDYDDRILLEAYVRGVEIAVSILGNEELEALPPVEIVPRGRYFDFESRYSHGGADFFCPARLDGATAERVAEVALRTHRALGCLNASRVDIIVDEGGFPQVLELNISPGMTETSLLPLAAEAAGMDFLALVGRLVELAFQKPPS